MFYNFLIMLTARYGSVAVAILDFEACVFILLSIFLVKKVNTLVFCYIASVAIALSSVFLLMLNSLFQLVLVFSIVPFFSVGLLIFFNYFQQITILTERARVVEIIAITALPFVFILGLLPPDRTIILCVTALIILLSAGFFLFNLFRTKVLVKQEEEIQRFFEKKVIFLYLLPWVIFSIINATLAKNNSAYFFGQTSASFHVILIVSQIVGVNFGAIIAGFVSDFFGRRIALALALTFYGTSSALGAVFTNPLLLSSIYLVDGISWGILFVMYIFIIWSDFANINNWAKMYSLGSVIYLLSSAIACITPESFLSISDSSLLTCLLAFLSILPIFIVPEIADRVFIEKTKLQRHIRKIMKTQNHG